MLWALCTTYKNDSSSHLFALQHGRDFRAACQRTGQGSWSSRSELKVKWEPLLLANSLSRSGYLQFLSPRPLPPGPTFPGTSGFFPNEAQNGLSRCRLRTSSFITLPPPSWTGDPPNKPLELLLWILFFSCEAAQICAHCFRSKNLTEQFENLLFPSLLRSVCVCSRDVT